MKKLIPLPVLLLPFLFSCRQPQVSRHSEYRYKLWLLDSGTYTTDQVSELYRIFTEDTTIRYAATDSLFAKALGDTLHFSIKKP